MREACQKMRDLLMLRGDGMARCVLTWDEFNESQKMLRAALATPARNCDKYSHDEALKVWAAEKEGPNNGCFDEWLYHNATDGDKK